MMSPEQTRFYERLLYEIQVAEYHLDELEELDLQLISSTPYPKPTLLYFYTGEEYPDAEV